jgi:hypothetical protein
MAGEMARIFSPTRDFSGDFSYDVLKWCLVRRWCRRAAVRGRLGGILRDTFMLRRQQRPVFTQADAVFNSGVPTLCFAVGQGILTPLQHSHRASSIGTRWYDCTGRVSRLAASAIAGQTGPEGHVSRLDMAHLF